MKSFMKGRRSFNSQVLYRQHLVLWEDMWMHCTLYSKTDIGHSYEDGGCLGECGHTSLSAASLLWAMLPRVHLVPTVFLQRWLLFWKVCGENSDPLCTRSGDKFCCFSGWCASTFGWQALKYSLIVEDRVKGHICPASPKLGSLPKIHFNVVSTAHKESAPELENKTSLNYVVYMYTTYI